MSRIATAAKHSRHSRRRLNGRRFRRFVHRGRTLHGASHGRTSRLRQAIRGLDVTAADGPLRCTMLELVQRVQRRLRSDREVVAAVKALVKSGAVVLTGTFRGQRF